jgi:CheY-like chemotaxis protein
VRAYSEGQGRGAEFVVRLPLAAVEVPLAVAGEDDEVVDHGTPLRVVVVEDQKDVREAMREMLAGWGHRVDDAADGESGIKRILELRPDVALIDIAMPGLDGYAVARHIRARLGDSSPRLVALTGFGREEDRDRARRAGFDFHLTKPAVPRDLRRALRSNTDDATGNALEVEQRPEHTPADAER